MGGPEWGTGLWQVGNGWSGSRLGVGERGAVRKWGVAGWPQGAGGAADRQEAIEGRRRGPGHQAAGRQAGKEGSYCGGRPPHPRLKRAEPPGPQETVACEIGGKAIFNFERHC